MRRDRLVQQCLRDRFVVTLDTKETFSGLLLDADEKTVHLTDCRALDGQAPPMLVDGDLYLPRNRVAYMQRPEAAR